MFRFYPCTKNSNILYLTLVKLFTCIEETISTFLQVIKEPSSYPLRQITMNNVSFSCITAAAGTGIYQS